MTQSNTKPTTPEKRPEWIEKAALAVVTLISPELVGELEILAAGASIGYNVARLFDAKRVDEHVKATKDKPKADTHATREKVAEIIHRHYQAHK